MCQLTGKSLKEIYDSIDSTFFTAAAFQIETPDKGPLIILKYRDNEDYFFRMEKQQNGYSFTYRPGDVLRTDSSDGSYFGHAHSKIRDWCNNILAELKVGNPFYDELQKVKAELSQKLDELYSDNKANFSPKEISALQAHLNDLSNRFDEFKKQNAVNEEELSELKRTLEALKSTLGNMPKKTWIRSAGNKLMDLSAKMLGSKAVQKLLIDAGHKLLPDVIPSSSPPDEP
jgi:hypothetical protein